jgi:hypothetical protein
VPVQISNPSAVPGRTAEVRPGAEIAARFGFPIAILLALMAATGFLLGIFTLPRSGPWCTVNCTAYPYVDAARFFPRDYFWMAPGILLAPLLLTVAACVHFCIPAQHRLFSLLAVCCGTLAAGFIAFDYFVQVLVVQTSLVHHEMDGVALLTQYNPHGLFIALEDLGYLLMAKGLLLLAMAVPSGRKHATALRWSLGIPAGLTFASFITCAMLYGLDMALPFELAAITFVWIGLIPSGILMALWFRHASRQGA